MFGWSPRGICLALAVLGLAGFVEGCVKGHDDRAFNLYGKHAMAQPADKIEQITHKRGNTVTRTDYNVALTFTTEDGQQVTVEHVKLARDQFGPAMGGYKLDIVYLPKNPTTIRWPGWEPQSSQTTWGCFLLFMGAGAGFWFLRKPR
jgi:hypothetical protein